MTFPEFMMKYFAGTMDTDAGWRAYDIEKYAGSIAKMKYMRSALKKLGLAYAGELALPEFCARYGVEIEAAPLLLACFWIWSLVDENRFCRVPLRSSAMP